MKTTHIHLAFSGHRLLVVQREGSFRPLHDEEIQALREQHPDVAEVAVQLPVLAERPVRTYDLPAEPALPSGMELIGLRTLGLQVDQWLFDLAGAALQKVEWERTHRFCARCGTPTGRHSTHEAMACPSCGQLHFPRVAPAVIVLVQRGREMLLGRSPHFAEGVYSTLAGFVEPGESLEGAVHREIEEEVGVTIGNLRYFGSQPWPFPHSLMIGFVADWVSGELRLQPDEIEDAAWFTPERLPPRLPFELSIARRLIDDFLERNA